MSKRLLVLLSPWCFLLFIGCSSDDSPPPSVAMCASATQPSLNDLNCLSQVTQQICCNEQAQVMQSYSAYCAQAVSGTGGYNLPPQPAQPVAQVPAQMPNCAVPTKAITCNEAVKNFQLQFNTTYSACPSNQQAQDWYNQQGQNVVSCVGSTMGVTSPEQYAADPQMQCMTQLTYQNFSTTAPPGVVAAVPAGTVPTTAVPAGAPPVAVTTTVTTTSVATPPISTLPSTGIPPTCGGTDSQVVCL